MIFKHGVEPWHLVPQVVMALQVCEFVYEKHAIWASHENEMVVTSLCDGQHGHRSYHYSGRAVDLRVHNIENPEYVYTQIAIRLRHIGFDVLLEGMGTEDAHIHIEYDPKTDEPQDPRRYDIVPL